MSNLVDVHTHFFSRPFFEALARLSPRPGSVDEKLAALSGATGIQVPGPGVAEHLARWRAQWDAHGVGHAVLFSSLPEETEAVAEAAALAAGRASAFGLVNPNAPDAPARVRRMFGELGYRGVLLFPAMHHVRVHEPAARAVLDVVAEHQGVAVVHCGLLQVKLRDLLGLPRPYDLSYANPLDLVPAANALPRVNFVIPHFGAGFLRETLMAGAQCENVFVDTSSSNSWIATQAAPLDLTEVLRRALGVFGPRRILFGTDSSTFPRGWRADLLASQVRALEALAVPAGDRAAILGDNARRLLGG